MEAENRELKKLVEEYNQTNKRLSESKKRLKRAQEIAHVGNWEIVLATRTAWVSGEAYQLFGMKMESHVIAINKILRLVYIEDRRQIYYALDRLMRGDAKFDVNFRIIRADNKKTRNMHSIAEVEYDNKGEAIKIVGVIQDITERINYEIELKNKNQELRSLYEELRESENELRRQFYVIKENEEKAKHMAFYDLITDLPNRMLFLDRLNGAIKLSKKKATQVIVVILDLDNFKIVNNTLGHAKGDTLLIETAKRLQKCITVKDTAARLSGDEFSLLLEDVKHEDEIVYFLKRIRSVFEEPFNIQNGTISLTASIGVSVYPDDGETNEELINNATTAMYKAKAFGKNRYNFFDYRMKHDLLRKIYIDRSLRKAIKNNEFILFYQPQYTVYRELRGFEALVRWNSPEMGFMNPSEFIPIAEESGLINQIGEWVLNTAVHTCKKFEDKYGLGIIMAVNISPVQLGQKDFIETVIKVIESSGIKPTSLELEVTESSFIDCYDDISHKLQRLKEVGVRVALDDFGTGYSSLSYLKKLPINLLKIDKSFIQEIDFINTQNNLTESIIALVNKLDIETVAEGVETIEQVNYLINAKCNYLQGYYLGKPGPEESLSRIIEKALQ